MKRMILLVTIVDVHIGCCALEQNLSCERGASLAGVCQVRVVGRWPAAGLRLRPAESGEKPLKTATAQTECTLCPSLARVCASLEPSKGRLGLPSCDAAQLWLPASSDRVPARAVPSDGLHPTKHPAPTTPSAARPPARRVPLEPPSVFAHDE